MSLIPNSPLHARALPTTQSLFPIGQGSSSWTTFPPIPHALPFGRATLNPTKVSKALPPVFIDAGPHGKKSIEVSFPKGALKLDSDPPGGLSFYSNGRGGSGSGVLDLATAKEVTFGYAVYFQKGFQWVKGGKLPGLYGGNSDAEATGCSGGARRTNCFSSRLMWRANGEGEIYSYFPPTNATGFSANKAICAPANNHCDPTHGTSIGRSQFRFPSGKWTTVTQRVRLNDVGKANGEVELFVDGKSVAVQKGIVMRDKSGKGRIRGLQVQCFFGGSYKSWASSKDQSMYLSDFSVAITKKL